MLNHLLTTVESIANRPNWLMSVADAIIEAVLSQKIASAGWPDCGCSPACKKKEWRWFPISGGGGCWHCVEVGGTCTGPC